VESWGGLTVGATRGCRSLSPVRLATLAPGGHFRGEGIGLIPVRLTRRPTATPCRGFLTTNDTDGADQCEFMRIRFICVNLCSSVAETSCGAAAGDFAARGDLVKKSVLLYLLTRNIPRHFGRQRRRKSLKDVKSSACTRARRAGRAGMRWPFMALLGIFRHGVFGRFAS